MTYMRFAIYLNICVMGLKEIARNDLKNALDPAIAIYWYGMGIIWPVRPRVV